MQKGSIIKYKKKLWLRISYRICNCYEFNHKYYLLQKDRNLKVHNWGNIDIDKFVDNGINELEVLEVDSSKKSSMKKSYSENDLIKLRTASKNVVISNTVDLLRIEEDDNFMQYGTTWAKIKLKKHKINKRTYKILKFAIFENNAFKKFVKIPLNVKILEY